MYFHFIIECNVMSPYYTCNKYIILICTYVHDNFISMCSNRLHRLGGTHFLQLGFIQMITSWGPNFSGPNFKTPPPFYGFSKSAPFFFCKIESCLKFIQIRILLGTHFLFMLEQPHFWAMYILVVSQSRSKMSTIDVEDKF